MKITYETYKTGSYYWFGNYPDIDQYAHDKDFIAFVDKQLISGYKQYRYKRLYVNNTDYFYYPVIEHNEFIDYLLHICEKTPMAICGIMVQPVVERMHITIDDLKKFAGCVKNTDSKHKYLEFIYNCIIENNDFVLTDEQRNAAYEIYKQYRKPKNSKN